MRISASQRARQRWHDRSMNHEVIAAFHQFQIAEALSPKTIRNRESILTSLARFIEVPLLEATTADLRAYLGRGGVQASTLRVERAAMVAFYAFAVDDGYLDSNPTNRLAPVRVPRRLPRPFTREQIDAMLTSGAYRRTRVMILLGYHQGFRVSQIARVRGDDIDLATMTIRTVAKGGKLAYLPLHETIAELAPTMPESWWFPSPHRDGPIRSESVTDAITAAKTRAGITDPTLTPHSLRHSYGSSLVEEGVDIRVVQELMLHEDLSTTQIYTHVSDSRKREGLSALKPIPLPAHSGRAGIVPLDQRSIPPSTGKELIHTEAA